MIYLATATALASLLTCWLMSRKVWYAPIVGLLSEVLWLALFLNHTQWPMLAAVLGYSVLYATAIPRWYRGRAK